MRLTIDFGSRSSWALCIEPGGKIGMQVQNPVRCALRLSGSFEDDPLVILQFALPMPDVIRVVGNVPLTRILAAKSSL